jgi:hypothetical protein
MEMNDRITNKSVIHLIERLNNITNLINDVWESGWWKISDSKAQELKGGNIYFHKKKNEPSFFGGKILGYRIEQDGTFKGRVVFKFLSGPEYKGVKTEMAGWANEKKMIIVDSEYIDGIIGHDNENRMLNPGRINDLVAASELLSEFISGSFKKKVKSLEMSFVAATKATASDIIAQKSIKDDLFIASLLIKKNASRIDEIIHTLGILIALPRIMDKEEIVEVLSLAAGNTGKGFDLETNLRIAEFTFINWKGGAEVIRQNKIFKDFYFLAEENTIKQKELYVIGTELPLKFLNSKRGIDRILAGNAKLGASFRGRYGDAYKKVCEYYETKRDNVLVKDIRDYLPILKSF